MTRILITASLLALVACGSDPAPPADEPEPTAEAAPDPDAPVASSDEEEAPPAEDAAPMGCDKEVALECEDEGEKDGCLVTTDDGATLTTVHVCTGETKPGAPCEQEIALECGDGYVDACLNTPALAATHVCVKQP